MMRIGRFHFAHGKSFFRKILYHTQYVLALFRCEAVKTLQQVFACCGILIQGIKKLFRSHSEILANIEKTGQRRHGASVLNFIDIALTLSE